MTTRDTIEEISAIVGRTTNLLIADIGIAGQQGADLRFAVGDLNANIAVYLADGTFANRLLQCFRLATAAGITILQLDAVLEQLTTEQPISLEASIVVENSITFALAQDGKIIGATTYTSRDDVDAAMKHMKGWFDIARDLVADTMDGPTYQALITLMAGITRYLTDVGRPLPRMVAFQMTAIMPALAISNLIYQDGSRDEEIAAENKIVHPAFCPISIRALSA